MAVSLISHDLAEPVIAFVPRLSKQAELHQEYSI